MRETAVADANLAGAIADLRLQRNVFQAIRLGRDSHHTHGDIPSHYRQLAARRVADQRRLAIQSGDAGIKSGIKASDTQGLSKTISAPDSTEPYLSG